MRSAVKLPALAAAAMLCTGCYTYVPAESGAPVAGREVAVVLTDRGRVALNDRVGPGIDQLRGVLVTSTDSNLTLAMKETVSLRGVSAKWTDEVVVLSRDHFGSLRLKNLSRGRTTLVAGGAVVMVGAIIATGSLVGSSSLTTPSGPTGEPPVSRISALSIPFRSNF